MASQTTQSSRASDKAKATSADGMVQDTMPPPGAVAVTPNDQPNPETVAVVGGPQDQATATQMPDPSQGAQFGIDNDTINRALDGDPEAESWLRKVQNRIIDPQTQQVNALGLVFPDLFEAKRQRMADESLVMKAQAAIRNMQLMDGIEEDVLAAVRSGDKSQFQAAIELGYQGFVQAGMTPQMAALKMKSLGATDQDFVEQEENKREMLAVVDPSVRAVVRHIKDPDQVDRVLAAQAATKLQTVGEEARAKFATDERMRLETFSTDEALRKDAQTTANDLAQFTIRAQIEAGLPLRDPAMGSIYNPETGKRFESLDEMNEYNRKLLATATDPKMRERLEANIRGMFGAQKGKAVDPAGLAGNNQTISKARKLQDAGVDHASSGVAALMETGTIAGALAIPPVGPNPVIDDVVDEVATQIKVFMDIAKSGASPKATAAMKDKVGLRQEFYRVLARAGVDKSQWDDILRQAMSRASQ